jgi:hypothetical protein
MHINEFKVGDKVLAPQTSSAEPWSTKFLATVEKISKKDQILYVKWDKPAPGGSFHWYIDKRYGLDYVVKVNRTLCEQVSVFLLKGRNVDNDFSNKVQTELGLPIPNRKAKRKAASVSKRKKKVSRK